MLPHVMSGVGSTPAIYSSKSLCRCKMRLKGVIARRFVVCFLLLSMFFSTTSAGEKKAKVMNWLIPVSYHLVTFLHVNGYTTEKPESTVKYMSTDRRLQDYILYNYDRRQVPRDERTGEPVNVTIQMWPYDILYVVDFDAIFRGKKTSFFAERSPRSNQNQWLD